jgi:hypothetical protein
LLQSTDVSNQKYGDVTNHGPTLFQDAVLLAMQKDPAFHRIISLVQILNKTICDWSIAQLLISIGSLVMRISKITLHCILPTVARRTPLQLSGWALLAFHFTHRNRLHR